MGRLGVDRRKFPAEGNIFPGWSAQIRIAFHLRQEVERILGKTSPVSTAIGSGITLVLDQVEIDIQAIGPQYGDASLQSFPRAEARRNRAFLVSGADIVIIEGLVSVGSATRTDISL